MSIKICDPSGMGWEQCTFRGSEIAQLRVWSALPLRKKLEALEELCDLSRRFIETRRLQGLPYVDPFTGKVVSGKSKTDPVQSPVI